MPRRKAIPVSTKREVLTEAGFRCAVPTCRTVLAIDVHHIQEITEGGGNEPSNLIALCPTCHALYHRGTIPREAIRDYKRILADLNHAFDQESVDLLLYLHRIRTDDFQYSGDGVLKFARLIAAGLVEFYTPNRRSLSASSASNHWLRLSQTGTLLVEAWLKGDRTAIEEALTDKLNAGTSYPATQKESS